MTATPQPIDADGLMQQGMHTPCIVQHVQVQLCQAQKQMECKQSALGNAPTQRGLLGKRPPLVGPIAHHRRARRRHGDTGGPVDVGGCNCLLKAVGCGAKQSEMLTTRSFTGPGQRVGARIAIYGSDTSTELSKRKGGSQNCRDSTGYRQCTIVQIASDPG